MKNDDLSRFASMTPAQKWETAKSLRDLAWKLKLTAVRHEHPDWSEEEIENKVKEIFLYAST
ncbi:MAG: hypothetical protein GX556_11690 [Fibrobacter sp.]|nr:hypothetical protein [Fibrobacter sp.]